MEIESVTQNQNVIKFLRHNSSRILQSVYENYHFFKKKCFPFSDKQRKYTKSVVFVESRVSHAFDVSKLNGKFTNKLLEFVPTSKVPFSRLWYGAEVYIFINHLFNWAYILYEGTTENTRDESNECAKTSCVTNCPDKSRRWRRLKDQVRETILHIDVFVNGSTRFLYNIV